MVTDVFALTAVVVIVNVPVVAPAATVAVAGTVAFVLFELRPTDAPPGPAGPVRVIVPVVEVPPTTAVGLIVMVEMPAALIVRVAVWLVPFRAPVKVTCVTDDTAVVVMAKLAEVAPAGTVTVAGTVALVELDERVTTVLGPAGPASVTVPVAGLPPITEVGETVTLVKPAGVIVRVAD